MSVGIYIGIANLIGILGFKPPTKDINVTASLAILSIILIELSGVLAKGGRGWLKSFAEPVSYTHLIRHTDEMRSILEAGSEQLPYFLFLNRKVCKISDTLFLFVYYSSNNSDISKMYHDIMP